MEKCIYYKVEQFEVESREIGLNRQQETPRTVDFYWCAHPNSPFDKKTAKSAILAKNYLNCNGDINQCLMGQDYFNTL